MGTDKNISFQSSIVKIEVIEHASNEISSDLNLKASSAGKNGLTMAVKVLSFTPKIPTWAGLVGSIVQYSKLSYSASKQWTPTQQCSKLPPKFFK